MTIPFIGQQLPDNPLTQIAANIRQIANPHWEMQLEMQRRMMADPSLVSQLAEVERNAPGTIAKLGFGKKLTGIIQSTPETLQQKQTKELRELQLQDAKNSLEQFNMKKTEFAQEQEDRYKKLKGIEAFKKFDIGKETENFVAGKPSNTFLKALQEAGNEAQQIFMANVQNLSGIRRLEQEHTLAMARIRAQENLAAAREDKSYQRALVQNAFDSWQKSGVGSTSAWKDVMDMDGDGQSKMQKFMQNPLLAKTDRDREILAIGQHLQQNQTSAKEFQKSQLLQKARGAMIAAQNKNLKKEEVAPYVQEMNSSYDAIRQLDPTFNLSVRQDGKNIKLVDENTGLFVSDETKATDISSLPTKEGLTHRQLLDQAVREYKNTPAILTTGTTKHSFMSEFKKKYGTEMYRLLVKRIQED